MSLFDEILDENRPPPIYECEGAQEDEELNDVIEVNDMCGNENDKGNENDEEFWGDKKQKNSEGESIRRKNSAQENEDDLRLDDDLRTRVMNRSGLRADVRPLATSRPSSAASSGGGDSVRSRSNGSAESAPSLSKQVQRLAKLGNGILNKAPKLSKGDGVVVDLSLPGEASKKSEVDLWFESMVPSKRKKAAVESHPTTVLCTANIPVKDAAGETVIERKSIVLNNATRGEHKLLHGIEGRKMVKGDLEAALAVKRREGLQQRRKWFNEDNPQPDDDEEESDAELTDNEENDENEENENDGSDQLDAGDDAASLTANELVDDEAVEDGDDDDAEKEAEPEVEKSIGEDEPADSSCGGTQPFHLLLDGEPDTQENDCNQLEAADDHSAHQTNGSVTPIIRAKKQTSSADFFDNNDSSQEVPVAAPIPLGLPTFLRPILPAQEKQSNHSPLPASLTSARQVQSELCERKVVSQTSVDNLDSQAFMAVNLHIQDSLPDSLSQWTGAGDISHDTSLISNLASDVISQEEPSNVVAEANCDQAELLNLCSGVFQGQSLPNHSTVGETDTIISSSADSELLGLCSGVFPDSGDSQQPQSSVMTCPFSSESCNNDHIGAQSADLNDEQGHISDSADEQARDGFESSSSTTSKASSKERRKLLTKRRRKRAVMSDSEDEEEEEEEKNGDDNAVNDENRTTPHTNDGISGSEDEEDEEAADDADLRNSSDDELAVFRRVEQIGQKASALFDKDKKLRRDFYDEEAELSGSDVGSGDEELGSDQDVYEAEEGDQDDIPEDEVLRDQVHRAFMKQQLDEDKRNILMYQEALLPDGDLHDDGDQNRRFRWRQREEEDALNAAIDDVDAQLAIGEQVDVDLVPEENRAGRVELIKWRASHDGEDDGSNDEAESDSQFLKMGQIALRRQTSSRSTDVDISVTSKAIMGGTSFLKRDATTLSLLTKGAGLSSSTNSKNTPSTLFSVVAESGSANKRPASGSDQPKQSLSAKRPKSSSITVSIFQHLAN